MMKNGVSIEPSHGAPAVTALTAFSEPDPIVWLCPLPWASSVSLQQSLWSHHDLKLPGIAAHRGKRGVV